MTLSFAPEAIEGLRGIYPTRPGLLSHQMVDHPLLTLEALVELSKRIASASVEYNRADLPIGIHPADTPANGLSVAETIRSIEQCGSWMVLKHIEQDLLYRDLLHEALAPLKPLVREVTGEMMKMQGFIFVSSPHAVTPFHFDPEHNILLQIRGSKTMTVFPTNDETLAPAEHHEAFHIGGHRNLQWRDEFAALGASFDLAPGDAIHVPVKAPHWVKNGPEPSISLSITWHSSWSFNEGYARSFNRLLRRAGMEPASPRPYPHRNLAKALAYRAVAKALRTGA